MKTQLLNSQKFCKKSMHIGSYVDLYNYVYQLSVITRVMVIMYLAIQNIGYTEANSPADAESQPSKSTKG